MIGGFAMEICRKCSIVYENRTCPLCNLREHDNLVHDFIESKGRSLVRELVAYLQHRKTAADSGAGQQFGETPAQHGQLAICAACGNVIRQGKPVATGFHCVICGAALPHKQQA